MIGLKALLFSRTRWKLYRNSEINFRKHFSNSSRARIIPSANVLAVSAAAISLSLYIASKNKIACDIDSSELSKTKYSRTYEEVIINGRDVLQRVKDEAGIPGIVIGVSVDGENVWEEGFGYADVENRVLCSPDTVMRIASISKSITMAAVAKLWEDGKLDIDKPVQEYVPSFPLKLFDGKPVAITCRQLVSHMGGIRHYHKESNLSKKSEKNDEMQLKEYYLKIKHHNLKTALEIFKDDPLENPGTKFLYSTHGFTLVSAVIEGAAKEPFTHYIIKLFKALGMDNTYLDDNDALIYNRSRNYVKNNKGLLLNAPYVDNSYKFAGGGFLSTVKDLVQFGNSMLYSFQFKPPIVNSTANKNMNINAKYDTYNSINSQPQLPGFLKCKTVESMWKQISSKYGMGWFVSPAGQACQYCANNSFCVYHTGGAIGASSILFIFPNTNIKTKHLNSAHLPSGIVVVIICNMQGVQLLPAASKIASMFNDVHTKFKKS